MEVIAVPAFPASDGTQMQGKKFWPRAGAYFADMLCIYGVTYVISTGLGFVIGPFLYLIAASMGRELTFLHNTTYMNYIVGITQTIIYFAVFEWLYGRTLGKIVLGLRVVSADGGSVSIKQAFIRSIYRLIDGLVLGAVAASAMKPPRYQRLGDQKAGTLVVAANDGEVKVKPAPWKFLAALAVYVIIDSLIITLSLLPFIRFI